MAQNLPQISSFEGNKIMDDFFNQTILSIYYLLISIHVQDTVLSSSRALFLRSFSQTCCVKFVIPSLALNSQVFIQHALDHKVNIQSWIQIKLFMTLKLKFFSYSMLLYEDLSEPVHTHIYRCMCMFVCVWKHVSIFGNL